VTEYVSTADLLEIGAVILGDDFQVRDPGLLASAAARPQLSVFGDDAYRTLSDKAAALMHSLARNDTLVDGNKRLAWVATVLFLRLNGRDLRAPSVDEGEELVRSVARGEVDAAHLGVTLLLWSKGEEPPAAAG